ncbi:MAG: hypothetical protein SGILL_008221 [Bacillariaceae sp.]
MSLLALLLLWLSKVSAQLQCSYSEEIALNAENTVFLQQYVNQQEGTYSVRLRYTEGYSWIGVGINYYDEAYMVPAYSVIGREEDDASVTVARYWLERTFVTGILPIEDPNEHLKAGARLIQENESTILEFTHDLVILEEGIVYENVTSDSIWIWAVGPQDNEWGTRHTLQGSFSVELSETCVDPSFGATNTTLPWGDGNNIGEDPTTETASSTNIVFNEPQTRASRGLWITHGLFMSFAWGILAPIAIGSSFFRSLGFLEKDARWFKLHMYLNLTVAFLTFVGFFLAIRATNKEGGQSHFKDNAHQKTGLTIFLFVLAQCLLGYFRPAKTASQNPPESKKDLPIEISKEGDDADVSNEDSTIVLAEHESSEKPTTIESPDNDEQDIDEMDKDLTNAIDGDDEQNNGFDVDDEQGNGPCEMPVANGDDEDNEQGFELDMADINALTEKTADTTTTDEIEISKEDDSCSVLSPPPPPSDAASSLNEENEKDEELQVDPGTERQKDDATPTTAPSESNQEPTAEESPCRTYWKITHRSIGIILIALAWFNCHTGIELLVAKYSADNEDQLLNVFWGFTGTIAVVFLIQGYVLRK